MEKGFVACALVFLFGCGAKNGTANDATSADAIKTPPTVEQAARILDLSTFPLMDGAKSAESRHVANLSYVAPGDAQKALEFNRKAFVAQGWKELPNSSITDNSASAMFARDGFVVALSVIPYQANGVSVRLLNLGNVKPGQLPVPPGVKAVYLGDPTAMYTTDAAVPATADAIRNLFVAQGWVPYGKAGDSDFFKRNAILATATVSSAPAQGGKTMIQYSNQLISSDIPALLNVEDLRYVDEPPELTFATMAKKEAIADSYRKTLAGAGWKSTMDKLVDVDEKPTMVFRNPANDMLTLSMSGGPAGKLLVSVRFQSAAEIAELDRRIKEEAPKIRAAAEAKALKEAAEFAGADEAPKVALTLPADAKIVEQTEYGLKFTVDKGTAKAAVESLRKQFRDDGWKENFVSLDGMMGGVSFTKGKYGSHSVHIDYTDMGLLGTTVTVVPTIAELEITK